MSALRAAQRRAEKAKQKDNDRSKPHDRIISAKEESFMNGYDEGLRYGTAEAVRMCTTAFISTIQNEYGLGKIRLERLLDLSMETFKQFEISKKHEQNIRMNILKKYNINLDSFTGCGKLDRSTEYIPTTVTKKQSTDRFNANVPTDESNPVMAAIISGHKEKASIVD